MSACLTDVRTTYIIFNNRERERGGGVLRPQQQSLIIRAPKKKTEMNGEKNTHSSVAQVVDLRTADDVQDEKNVLDAAEAQVNCRVTKSAARREEHLS